LRIGSGIAVVAARLDRASWVSMNLKNPRKSGRKVKEKWGKLTDDDLPPSTVAAISSREKFKSDTASPRIKSARMSTLG
jgi:hypothetical protein